MKTFIASGIILAGALFMFHCSQPTDTSGNGGGSETGNAMIYMPDGTPAAGARVRICPVSNLPGTAKAAKTEAVMYETTTDEEGQYTVPALSRDLYNILASKDSLALKQDSVLIAETENSVKSDTLRPSGGLIAHVKIQPNHDPRTVVAQLVGTYYFSNVDSNAAFGFISVPSGKYALRLSSTLPSYTPTYYYITIRSGAVDTVPTPFELIYTGIPVVSGLRAEYDTLNGVIRVSWNASTYRDLMDYLVFRDEYSAMLPSTSPVAALIGTDFIDTIYNPQWNWDDSLNYHYKYRVCVRSNETVQGTTYGFVDAQSINPKSAFSLFPVDTQKVLLRGLCTLQVRPCVWYKGMARLECDLGGTGVFKEWSKPETTFYSDSFAEYPLIARFTDTLGRSGTDTLRIRTCIRFEKAGSFSLTSEELETAKYTVAGGNRVWLFIQSGGSKLYKSDDGLQWDLVSADLPFAVNSTPAWFRDSLLVADSAGTLWISSDGLTWNSRPLGTAYPRNELCVSDSLIYLFLISTAYRPYYSVFKSTDAASWTTVSGIPQDYLQNASYSIEFYTLFAHLGEACYYINRVMMGNFYSLLKIGSSGVSVSDAGCEASPWCTTPGFTYFWNPPIFSFEGVIVGFGHDSYQRNIIKYSHDGVSYSSNLDLNNQATSAGFRVVFPLNNNIFWVSENGVFRF